MHVFLQGPLQEAVEYFDLELYPPWRRSHQDD